MGGVSANAENDSAWGNTRVFLVFASQGSSTPTEFKVL